MQFLRITKVISHGSHCSEDLLEHIRRLHRRADIVPQRVPIYEFKLVKSFSADGSFTL